MSKKTTKMVMFTTTVHTQARKFHANHGYDLLVAEADAYIRDGKAQAIGEKPLTAAPAHAPAAEPDAATATPGGDAPAGAVPTPARRGSKTG